MKAVLVITTLFFLGNSLVFYPGVEAAQVVVTEGLLVLPVGPVAVAPGQPEVGSDEAATPDSGGVRTGSPTAGIINAICSVRLNVVGCGFLPDAAVLSCDSDGNGTPDLPIQLTDITLVNPLLFRVTIPSHPSLRGTPFPLSCCGGIARLTFSKTVAPGDEITAPFILKTHVNIDLGLRAPVILSVTPSTADCATPQNLLLSGACFTTPSGTPNVTAVFARERTNPGNAVTARSFSILSSNLLDADFDFGAGNAGKSFLFFANGPNGTSRNLTSLPAGAGTNCPLGNEAGIQVMFTCTAVPVVQPNPATVTGCLLDRTPAGGFLFIVTGLNIQDGATITINNKRARKVKFKQLDIGTNTFRSVQIKGGVCNMVPGMIVITNPDEPPSEPFQCNLSCE
jgi:hypothetical protein